MNVVPPRPAGRGASGALACRAAVALGLAALAVLAWWLLRDGGALERALDVPVLVERVRALGAWGPLGVVALISAAILVSPLPSAPVALAAGAAYGHTWGTLYVAAGSVLGASAAFALARYLGHDFVHRHLGDRLSVGLAGSQRVLMATVFVSRLLPFLSFDLISYAAGLTVLSFWRFVTATVAGILPASFALAHFGSELGTDAPAAGWFAIVVLGVLGVAPLLLRAARGRAQDPD